MDLGEFHASHGCGTPNSNQKHGLWGKWASKIQLHAIFLAWNGPGEPLFVHLEWPNMKPISKCWVSSVQHMAAPWRCFKGEGLRSHSSLKWHASEAQNFQATICQLDFLGTSPGKLCHMVRPYISSWFYITSCQNVMTKMLIEKKSVQLKSLVF